LAVSIWRALSSASVAHFEHPFHDHGLHGLGKLQQPQEVRGRAAGTTDRVSSLLVSHVELVDEPLQARRLFHRVEVFPLNVLDQRHRQRGFVRDFPYQRRDFLQTGHLRRPPPPLAGDELVAVSLNAPYEQRLHQALRLDGRGKFCQRLLVHLGSRLVFAWAYAAHRKRCKCVFRRLIAAQQRIQTAPQPLWLDHVISTVVGLPYSFLGRPSISSASAR
jgi:hypothetical protein